MPDIDVSFGLAMKSQSLLEDIIGYNRIIIHENGVIHYDAEILSHSIIEFNHNNKIVVTPEIFVKFRDSFMTNIAYTQAKCNNKWLRALQPSVEMLVYFCENEIGCTHVKMSDQL
ncbi:MAG: hypothetical protein ACTSUE_15210 [Promethearchaeota archaeon]